MGQTISLKFSRKLIFEWQILLPIVVNELKIYIFNLTSKILYYSAPAIGRAGHHPLWAVAPVSLDLVTEVSRLVSKPVRSFFLNFILCYFLIVKIHI